MKKLVYHASLVLTAASLFWPVIYSNVSVLQRIPCNPVLQAIAGVLIFGSAAYLSYEEEKE